MTGSAVHRVLVQQTEIVTGGASRPVVVRRRTPPQHGQPRRFIDAAASALTSPFRSLVQSDSLARFSRGLSGGRQACSPHAHA